MKDIDISDFTDESIEYGKKYSLIALTISVSIYVISIFVAMLAAWLVRVVCLKGAFIIDNKPNLTLSFISGLAAGTGIMFLFEKKILLKFTNNRYKDYVSARHDWDMKNYNKFWKFLSKITGVIIVFGAVIFGLVSLNLVGLYDDCVKHSTLMTATETIPYENVEFYKIMGHYDLDEEVYLQYDKNVYALVFNECDIILTDECDNESDADKKIKSIAKKYNKEIKAIRSDDELYDIYYEEE